MSEEVWCGFATIRIIAERYLHYSLFIFHYSLSYSFPVQQ